MHFFNPIVLKGHRPRSPKINWSHFFLNSAIVLGAITVLIVSFHFCARNVGSKRRNVGNDPKEIWCVIISFFCAAVVIIACIQTAVCLTRKVKQRANKSMANGSTADQMPGEDTDVVNL